MATPRPVTARVPVLLASTALALLCGSQGARAQTAPPEPAVALHVGSLPVSPAHLPGIAVTVSNRQDEPATGEVAIELPEGWTFRPDRIPVSIEPGRSRRVVFSVTRGVADSSNRYPITATLVGSGLSVRRTQHVVAASAPYFKPDVDGAIDDWKDAIAAAFDEDERTVVRTYWNRRRFSILVSVREDRLVTLDAEGPLDAVQLAISPEGAQTGTTVEEESARYEFLLAATGAEDGDASGACFQLAAPGTKLAVAAERRKLGPLAQDSVDVAVSRTDGVTHYECSIPFKLLSKIRPSEGREFCMSILVHDGDAREVRDWGRSTGLAAWQRNRLAWSRWTGDSLERYVPFDNKCPWGLCSSKY